MCVTFCTRPSPSSLIALSPCAENEMDVYLAKDVLDLLVTIENLYPVIRIKPLD